MDAQKVQQASAAAASIDASPAEIGDVRTYIQRLHKEGTQYCQTIERLCNDNQRLSDELNACKRVMASYGIPMGAVMAATNNQQAHHQLAQSSASSHAANPQNYTMGSYGTGFQVTNPNSGRFVFPVPAEKRYPPPAPDWSPLTSPGGSPVQERESGDGLQHQIEVAVNAVAGPSTSNNTASPASVAENHQPKELVDYALGRCKVSKMINLAKRTHTTKQGKPNRPWLFGYTFQGSDKMGIYYLSCPNHGCGAMNMHPLKEGRGEIHLDSCHEEWDDEDSMISLFATQVVRDNYPTPLTIDWARNWNRQLMDCFGLQHLAHENFPEGQ